METSIAHGLPTARARKQLRLLELAPTHCSEHHSAFSRLHTSKRVAGHFKLKLVLTLMIKLHAC
jgi:hypothetical protein